MDRIDLNDLPKYSQWPTRLLGLESFSTPSRTREKVDKEYDKDKYARCLDFFIRTGRPQDPEQIKRFEFGLEPEDKICISEGENLYLMEIAEARRKYYQILLQNLSPMIEGCYTVVELGAGYGYNLWMLKHQFPNKIFLGGEYSSNAVQLASGLFADGPKVVRFDFYDSHTYGFLADATPPVLVFTSHAIEQLPFSRLVFESLEKYQGIVKFVVHFEPVQELHGSSLLGLCRKRYAEINDYNRDILSELMSRSSIRINSVQPNVFGLNPLNSTSIICWEYIR